MTVLTPAPEVPGFWHPTEAEKFDTLLEVFRELVENMGVAAASFQFDSAAGGLFIRVSKVEMEAPNAYGPPIDVVPEGRVEVVDGRYSWTVRVREAR